MTQKINTVFFDIGGIFFGHFGETALPKLEKNYELGIISNHGQSWVEWLMDYQGFGKHFKYPIFSCDDNVKCGKPGKRIYQAALELSGRKPEECMFIDDKFPNVEAARGFGFHSFVYTMGEHDLEEKLRENGLIL